MGAIKLRSEMTKDEFKKLFSENYEYVYIRVKSSKGGKTKLGHSKFFTEGAEVSVDGSLTVEDFEKEATSKSGMEVLVYFETKPEGKRSKYYQANKEDAKTTLADLEARVSGMENILSQKENTENLDGDNEYVKILPCDIDHKTKLLVNRVTDDSGSYDITYDIELDDEFIIDTEMSSWTSINDIFMTLDLQNEGSQVKWEPIYEKCNTDKNISFDEFINNTIKEDQAQFLKDYFTAWNLEVTTEASSEIKEIDDKQTLYHAVCEDFMFYSVFILTDDKESNKDYLKFLKSLRGQDFNPEGVASLIDQYEEVEGEFSWRGSIFIFKISASID